MIIITNDNIFLTTYVKHTMSCSIGFNNNILVYGNRFCNVVSICCIHIHPVNGVRIRHLLSRLRKLCLLMLNKSLQNTNLLFSQFPTWSPTVGEQSSIFVYMIMFWTLFLIMTSWSIFGGELTVFPTNNNHQLVINI